ncbi:MAG: YigZ family protein [bacterium]
MLKIKNHIENTIIVDKSTFITNIYLVDNTETIKEILLDTKKKYNDANHNCYAYVLENGLIQKCSDDGEPVQTAGYPMLDVLKKQNITNVLAITTRYFGGVKLGTGGLVRAYSKSVSDALLQAEFTTSKEFDRYELEFEYSYYNYINTLENITIETSDFTDIIKLVILISVDNTEDVLEKIKNLTKSKVSIKFIEKIKLDV